MGRHRCTLIFCLLTVIRSGAQTSSGVDLRPFCPTAANQGELPACLAYSAAFAYSITHNIHNKQTNRTQQDQQRFSASFLYNLLHEPTTSTVPNALSLESLLYAYRTIGALPVADFPESARFQCYPDAGQRQLAGAWKATYAATLWQKKDSLAPIALIEQILSDSFPLIAQCALYQSLETIKPDQQPWTMQLPDKYVGAHSLLIVGYDQIKQEFILLNSRGAAWCERGFVRIHYKAFIQILLSLAVLVPPCSNTRIEQAGWAGSLKHQADSACCVLPLPSDPPKAISTLHIDKTDSNLDIQDSQRLRAASGTKSLVISVIRKGKGLKLEMFEGKTDHPLSSNLLLETTGLVSPVQLEYEPVSNQFFLLAMLNEQYCLLQINENGQLFAETFLSDSLWYGLKAENVSMIIEDQHVTLWGQVTRLEDGCKISNPVLLRLTQNEYRWTPQNGFPILWTDLKIHKTGMIAHLKDGRYALPGSYYDDWGQTRGFIWIFNALVPGIKPANQISIEQDSDELIHVSQILDLSDKHFLLCGIIQHKKDNGFQQAALVEWQEYTQSLNCIWKFRKSGPCKCAKTQKADTWYCRFYGKTIQAAAALHVKAEYLPRQALY